MAARCNKTGPLMCNIACGLARGHTGLCVWWFIDPHQWRSLLLAELRPAPSQTEDTK